MKHNQKITFRKRFLFAASMLTCVWHFSAQSVFSACTEPQNNGSAAYLQSVLDTGGDLILCNGEVYEIYRDSLRLKNHGQAIYTENPTTISEYATLRSMNKDQLAILNGEGLNDIRLEHLIFDGNKYGIGSKPFYDGEKALIMMGVGGRQIIRNNLFMSTRSWSTLKLHESPTLCGGGIVENNIFLGAGVGARGNGRGNNEPVSSPNHWGDAISMGCHETTIRNNLFLDHTDVAIAIFSAPGSIIENNVATSVSREALGAFNMVDTLSIFALEGSGYSYRGVNVRNNLLDAFGARIHIGIPLGPPVWAPKNLGYHLVGASVVDNHFQGDAFGYGIAIAGVAEFTVTGNTSSAKHQGKVDTDPVSPFMYTASETGPIDSFGASTLQSDFVATTEPFRHILRTTGGFRTDDGLYAGPYEDDEVTAVVRAAYMEMLGRLPTQAEADEKEGWLNTKTNTNNGDRWLNTSDQLRMDLMNTQEFKDKYPGISVNENAMQLHRIDRWIAILEPLLNASLASSDWVPSDVLYASLVADMSEAKYLGIISPNGGDTLNLSSSKEIRWSTKGEITSVKLEYQLNGGSWTEISASAPNTGTYTWNMPGALVNGKVKIKVSEVGGTAISDESNTSFTVVPAVGTAGRSPITETVLLANGRKLLTIPYTDIRSITIFDLKGKLLEEILVDNYQAVLSRSKLTTGLYILKLQSKNQTLPNMKVLLP